VIPAAFDYVRAGSLDEALRLLAQHGDEAKLLAGGHSLLPAMKLRLAQPRVLIDIGRLAELDYIREEGGRIAIGALTTHDEIDSSSLLRERCPLLPEVASYIGDVQVRNRGTIGGSLVQADPAADWPAAVLALEAELELAGPQGRRRVSAAEFFVDMFQTALKPGEILAAIRVSPTPRSVAYEKFAQKASGFAIAGVAVVVEAGAARIGITGVAGKPYRASAVEAGLRGGFSASAIAAAAGKAAQGIDALSDIHASSEYRSHLAGVLTRRALERALARA
jgi:carbon-monoxide dehydrogenase medium subunit